MNDLISRGFLLKSIDNIDDSTLFWGRPFSTYKETFKEFVKGMPSVEKKGKWVQTNPPERSDNIVCDQCGYDSIAEFIYCPNCGSKMEVTE